MTLLLVSVSLVLGVSALCSLSEAALYSVRMPFVRHLADSGSPAGAILARFKLNMDRPITAILIVNTVANTAGAAVAGAQARQLFGEASLLWFSASFTLAVLFFSEILPKVAGVTYRRPVSRLISWPLDLVIRALHPLVWLTEKMTRLIQSGDSERIAPEEEVHQMAILSAEEGSILPQEAELVRNVLRLNEIQARDIMTPGTVVFKLDASATVEEVAEELQRRPHSRIPIHKPGDPDDWVGQVIKDDILSALARDEFDLRLESIRKPIGFVPEVVPGHQLLNEFLRRRAHLLGVIDEYGGVRGVVTLEDVLESLLGEEIVDETDLIVDMQHAARERGTRKLEQAASESRQPQDDPETGRKES